MEYSMQWITSLFLAMVFINYAVGLKQNITDEFRYHEVSHIFISGNLYDRSIHANKLLHPREIELTFSAHNQSFTIPLVLMDDLLSDAYIEKHYISDTDFFTHKPSNKSHKNCYYQSTSSSVSAAISTCDGISGYATVEEETFYIHPVHSDIKQHYIFRQSDHIIPHGKCGVEHASTADFKHHLRKKRSVHKPYDANSKSRYVELYMVADSKEFYDMEQNRNRLIHRIKEIVNIVNSLYRQLNIYIALVGIEIWEHSDRIVVESSADKTMNNFLAYRKQYINPDYRNDNAQLLSGRKFDDGIVGKAMKEPICTFLYSGGVSYDSSLLTKIVAVTLAHEMGHNFGFEHDDDTCSCPNQKCIMAAVSGLVFPTKWSSCSRTYLKEAFDAGMDYCLRELPETLYKIPLCGNGFLEEGEECDCGLVEDCTSVCCNATTCKFLPNATCATGECCDQQTCQLKPVYTECRAASGECDLPEFCSGKTEFCPSDVFKQDGSDCLDETAYCYNGKCHTYDKQCQFLWGPTGRKGHELCYTRLNHEGSGNGNCGFNWLTKTFKACQPQDVFCGMLHCYHQTEKLHFWKPSLTYLMPELHITTSQGERHFCQSAILDVGFYTPDPGMVPDGTKCGANMMCMNQQCMTKRLLNFPSCSSNCSEHGVCNNKGHCHCDCGYAPPHCNATGRGGSEESGPICDGPPSGFQWWIAIVLLIILVVVAVIALLLVRCRNAMRIWWREKTYSLASRIGRCSELLTKCHSRPHPTAPPPPPPTAPELDGVAVKPVANGPYQPTQAKAQRSHSINRGEISGPIFQSTTLESKNLVQLQKPLYENEVFRPGNKKARPPSFADVDNGPQLPPRSINNQSELYLSPKPMPSRSAPPPPKAPQGAPVLPISAERKPPVRPAPILTRPSPSASIGLTPSEIIVKFNQNSRGMPSSKT